MKYHMIVCDLRYTSTLSAENLIEIGSGVSEIWPGKFKCWDVFIQAGAFIQQNTVFDPSLAKDQGFIYPCIPASTRIND